MKEIKLTGTLKTYKAIVINPNESVPDDYISIAGYISNKGDYEIAVPEKIMNNKALFDKLAEQAEGVLLNGFIDELTEG
jgi:hypothetical protein